MSQSYDSSTSSFSQFSFKEEQEHISLTCILQKSFRQDFPLFIVQRDCFRQQSSLVSKLSVNYNRKQKSLEWLSRKFLQKFADSDKKHIQLDKITIQLGVQRRRIYDIVNILQSVGLVKRKGKNSYIWRGLSFVKHTISMIKKFPLKIEQQQGWGDVGKKGKSLQILSKGFLNLFINWRKMISLQTAAKKLCPPDLQQHKLKTKIRRLYDIANVFKSLGLVKKSKLDNKKPGFQWIGKEDQGKAFVPQIRQSQIDSTPRVQASRLCQILLVCQSQYQPHSPSIYPIKKSQKSCKKQFLSTCSSFKKVQAC